MNEKEEVLKKKRLNEKCYAKMFVASTQIFRTARRAIGTLSQLYTESESTFTTVLRRF